MRFVITTLLCALAAAPSIMAIPSASPVDLLSPSSLVERDVYDNASLVARHGGGKGKDHCHKGNGRRGDNCQCYPGLHCDNDYDKCECGDQGNAYFSFKSNNDDPKCACTGSDQKYDTHQGKCVCNPGFEPQYKQGKLQCKKPTCGKYQHYDDKKHECVCDTGCKRTWKNSKLVCEPPQPTCEKNQHYSNSQHKCVCNDGFDASWKNGKLVCKPCEPKCGLHQHVDSKTHQCVCDQGYDPKWSYGKLECKACPPTHSKRWNEPQSVETGRVETVDFRTKEDLLGCSASQVACKIASTWTCFDSFSNLASCGGCPGEGRDCSAIEGVEEVRCAMGQCVIDSCQKGLTVDQASGTCVVPALFTFQ